MKFREWFVIPDAGTDVATETWWTPP